MSWSSIYPNGITSLQISKDESWRPFFEQQADKLQTICKKLNAVNLEILLPYPENIFRALDLISLDKVKIVILGQDPYHTIERQKTCDVVLATGLSFSIPSGAKIPSSLQNIYKNQIKFKHIEEKGNGNLESWAIQGCLMLNTSLTVTQGSPNCHKKLWADFTDALIKYISDNTNNVVFLLWGKESYNKKYLIDDSKHFTIVSSHPSGFSYDKKMGTYDAFINTDHFGLANEYLVNHGKNPIKW